MDDGFFWICDESGWPLDWRGSEQGGPTSVSSAPGGRLFRRGPPGLQAAESCR